MSFRGKKSRHAVAPITAQMDGVSNGVFALGSKELGLAMAPSAAVPAVGDSLGLSLFAGDVSVFTGVARVARVEAIAGGALVDFRLNKADLMWKPWSRRAWGHLAPIRMILALSPNM